MSDTRELLRRGVEGFEPMPDAFERVLVRRDRKRWNQRIKAGAVGIAVFVAAVWFVTTGWPLDRSETPAATVRVETVPAPAPGAPDVVKPGTCSDGAGVQLELTHYAWVRLELTDIGDRIKVRFEIHRSPVGHEWSIMFHYVQGSPIFPVLGHTFFRGTRVASDSGVVVVQLHRPDWGDVMVVGRAVDSQTGQFCRVRTST